MFCRIGGCLAGSLVSVATTHVVRTLRVEVDIDNHKDELLPKVYVNIPPNSIMDGEQVRVVNGSKIHANFRGHV